MILPYKDKKDLYHYTNNGKFMYIQKEYNDLIYNGGEEIPSSPLITKILKYTGINKPSDILYTKGDISELLPFKIGEGTEATVFNNTPLSVIKVLSTSPKQMRERNMVPTAIPCNLRVIVEDNDDVRYVYFQTKVNIIPREDLAYAFKTLDIIMMKCGFFQAIGCSDDTIRIYTDGFSVIDDIGYGNIGYGLDGRIHVIDCAVYDIDDWEMFNDLKVHNKVACIAYNSGDTARLLDGHFKLLETDIASSIKKYEDELNRFLKENNVEFDYEHIKLPE